MSPSSVRLRAVVSCLADVLEGRHEMAGCQFVGDEAAGYLSAASPTLVPLLVLFAAKPARGAPGMVGSNAAGLPSAGTRPAATGIIDPARELHRARPSRPAAPAQIGTDLHGLRQSPARPGRFEGSLRPSPPLTSSRLSLRLRGEEMRGQSLVDMRQWVSAPPDTAHHPLFLLIRRVLIAPPRPELQPPG